jgi:hypothetical protein
MDDDVPTGPRPSLRFTHWQQDSCLAAFILPPVCEGDLKLHLIGNALFVDIHPAGWHGVEIRRHWSQLCLGDYRPAAVHFGSRLCTGVFQGLHCQWLVRCGRDALPVLAGPPLPIIWSSGRRNGQVCRGNRWLAPGCWLRRRVLRIQRL